MKSENVLSWNVPNVISIWLMLALLWVVMGIGSHMIFRKHAHNKPVIPAVGANASGDLVPVS